MQPASEATPPTGAGSSRWMEGGCNARPAVATGTSTGKWSTRWVRRVLEGWITVAREGVRSGSGRNSAQIRRRRCWRLRRNLVGSFRGRIWMMRSRGSAEALELVDKSSKFGCITIRTLLPLLLHLLLLPQETSPPSPINTVTLSSHHFHSLHFLYFSFFSLITSTFYHHSSFFIFIFSSP